MYLNGDPQTSRTIRVIVAACMRHDDSRQAVLYAYRRVRLYASSLFTFVEGNTPVRMSDEIIKFINLIEERECIYRSNLQSYSNKNANEKAWSEIAKHMNWTVTFCKEKWRNIRNGFVRSLKPSASGSSASQKKKYYLHDVMGFVLPYVKPVQHAEQSGNIILSDLDEHDLEVVEGMENTQENSDIALNIPKCNETTSFGIEKKKKIRKCSNEHDAVDKAVLAYIEEKKGREAQDNSRRMFLLSLLPDLNNLSDRQFRQFKIRSMLMVQELLNEGPAPSTPKSDVYSSAADIIYTSSPPSLEVISSGDTSNSNTWDVILNP